MTVVDEFMIGTVAGGLDGMVTLQSILNKMDIPSDPDWEYTPYSGFIEAGDGSRKGIGAPTATWHWGALTVEQRMALRSYCQNGISNSVLIRTKKNDLDVCLDDYLFGNFEAQMYWPPASEQHDTRYVTDFTLEFRFLVPVSIII